MTKLTIGEVLRGCEVGRMQTVGLMQMIPLLSDLEDDRFAAPTTALMRTQTYGSMGFKNPETKTMLLPLHAAYMVKEAAQDHAMSHAALIKGNKEKTFSTAMCVQQNQGGTIPYGAHSLVILPHVLREPALANREKRDYSKLWSSIAALNRDTGGSSAGNLIDFVSRFEKELDEFVAEFERVPQQIGAVILIGNRVMGVERSPSRAYFAAVWEPLIRECYGSEAIRLAKLNKTKPPARAPLRSVNSLDDLSAALGEARTKDEESAKGRVRALINDDFKVEADDKEDPFVIETIGNPQFFGQIVREGERVHYASLITRSGWSNDEVWRSAKAFAI